MAEQGTYFILVDAAPEELRRVLREEFTEGEIGSFRVSEFRDEDDELLGGKRGLETEIGFAMVEFAATAIAGGMLYDVVKKNVPKLAKSDLAQKVMRVIRERFGQDAIIHSSDDEPSGPEKS